MTQLDTIRNHIAPEFNAVNQLITTRLHSQVTLINQLSTHIINSGGKRIRPMLVLLSAKACNYKGNNHITLAAVVEFIHTATLLHDDVVDESTLRRGQETANTIWGSDASVLVGDFLYSRAFEMIVDVNNMDAMGVLAKATNTIAEGEVMQLMQCHDPDTTEQRYMDVICSKTATLFQAAAQFGAIIGQNSKEHIDAMGQYGLCLGNAFQLIDDALDYCASSDTIGKNIGDDLADGKPTLPIIHAMAHTSEKQKNIIRQAITEGNIRDLDTILKAIESTDAIAYTRSVANQEIDRAITALQALPKSPTRDALQKLAEFAVNRNY